MTIGEQIVARMTKVREALELSKYELEIRCGFTHGYIGRLERGERAKEIRAETVIVLAHALGVEPGWLLTGRGKAPIHGVLAKPVRRKRKRVPKASRASRTKKRSR